MLQHYWKTALRNLLRNKLFTSINVIGLSVSIAIFLALTAYVKYQFSYDKFYPEGDRIYRVDYYEYQQGIPVLQSARTHDRTALLVHEYVPQAEAVSRVYNEKAYVFTEDTRIVDQDMLFVDSSFFKVFPVKVISGSAETSLIAPNSVMISKSQAAIYFGDQEPLGKVLYFNERLPFTVTGVFEDIPKTTSIDYNFLLSWSTLWTYGWTTKDGDFNAPYAFTFVKLREHATDIAAVNKELTALANEQNRNLLNRNHTARQELRPYQDLHTLPELSGEIKPSTNKTLLYALVSLAVFILCAAWINYINLSLARSIERADEIGVRKVFGASRMAIGGQFLLEAFILAVTTFVLGFGLYLLFTGPFSGLFFSHLNFLPTGIPSGLLYFIGFVAITTLIAFYPALFMSKYKPALILNNKLGGGKGGANLLYNGLMVFQLFLAVAIVGITLIASRQIRFMREFDTGFNAKQTISLRAPASTNSDSLRYTRYTAFRAEVLQNHAFKSGTSSMNIPGQEIRFHDEAIRAVGQNNEKKQSFWVLWVDEGYQETFGLTLLAGRNFNQREFGATCLINETAARALGYKSAAEAVNTSIVATGYSKPVMIVGVWKDYHHESVRKPVDPIVFYFRHPIEYGYYSFSVQSREGNYLESLKKIWAKHYPNDTFTFYFMDQFFEDQYQSDELFGKLLTLFSVISIMVASLGLFGMASLAMVKRTKEIGVRKVLGATVWNILVMLSSGYVKLIAISCLFAFPMAWYATDRWLSQFSYKIQVNAWMIVLPGFIVLVATLLTIGGQSIKAALANPSKSLRDQ